MTCSRLATLFIILFLPALILAQSPVIKGLKTKTVKVDTKTITVLNGYITVPEDRENPSGRILKLPVRVYKSTNPNPLAPIFWLNGGPGASNIVKLLASEYLENHDVVMVGYRGADGNSRLNSKQLSKAMKGKKHQLLSDRSLDNSAQKFTDYLDALKKKGVDIRQYTIMHVIEDLEYVRQAMGVPQINLYGSSYGTRVALLYSYKYADRIKRTVMAGANPPGHFVWYPDKTEQILKHYDSLYHVQNPRSSPDAVRTAIRHAFEKMPKRWALHRLDPDKIKAMTFGFLFSTDGAAMVFDAYFKAADKGDYSGLYLIQLFFDIGMSRVEAWGDMYQKALSADFEAGKNSRGWFRSFDKTTALGSNYSLLLWGSANGSEYNLIPEEYRKLRKSDTPTLIISGNLDVSTPADFSKEKLLPTLTNGNQVILKEFSHAMTNGHQKEHIRGMIAHFFKTGIVDASAIKYQPFDFKPKKHLTKMAKRGYPLWVVLNWVY